MVMWLLIIGAVVVYLSVKGTPAVSEGEDLEDTIVPSGDPEDRGQDDDPQVRQGYLNAIAPIITWLQNLRSEMTDANSAAQSAKLDGATRHTYNCWIKPRMRIDGCNTLIQRHAGHYFISIQDLQIIRDDVDLACRIFHSKENSDDGNERSRFRSISSKRQAVQTVLMQYDSLEDPLLDYYETQQVFNIPELLSRAPSCD